MQEIYEVEEWHHGGTAPYRTRPRENVDAPHRREFVGRVAPKEIRDRYLRKRVDAYFGTKAQNPLRSVEC